VELAKQVKEGTYRGDVVLRGMAEGTIDFVVNPAMEPRLPAGLAAELATLKEKIRTGALVVPKDEF
jgi:hypothetical protein